VSYKNALIQRALAMSLAMSAAACANLPEASLPAASPQMVLGAAATPPRGFVEFCQRSHAECGADAAELKVMVAEVAKRPPQPAAAAIQYDWSEVFARARMGAAPVAPTPLLSRAVMVSSPAPAPVAAPMETPAADAPRLTPQFWKLLTGTNDKINGSITQRSDKDVYGVDEYWNTPLEAGLATGDCEDFVLEKRHALIAQGVPASALSIAVVNTIRGETHAVLLVATDHGEYAMDSLTPWILPWEKTGYHWRERQVAGSPSRWAMAANDTGAPAPAATPTPALMFASLR